MDKPTNRGLKWFHPDVPKSVRSHLLGEHHSPRHKFLYGTFIMFVGVSLVKAGMVIDSIALHIVTDVIGYGLHGIGAIPIIKSIDREGKI